MLQTSRLVRYGLWLGLAIALLASIGWGFFQPWAANRFGYALPGLDHLPDSITYAGQQYSNPNECAGDDWCQPADKSCMSTQQLKDVDLWPLKQVGSIPTLFGSAHPILAPLDGEQTFTFLFVLDTTNCYLTYALMGGA